MVVKKMADMQLGDVKATFADIEASRRDLGGRWPGISL
jgi:hypothetical protein